MADGVDGENNFNGRTLIRCAYQLKRGSELDCLVQCPVEGAMHRVIGVYALHDFFRPFWCFQAHGYVDAPDDQHAFFGFHLAGYIRR